MNHMKKGVGLLAVAGLAFAAGRMDVLAGGSNAALADEKPQDVRAQAQEMNREEMAWIAAMTPGKNHEYLDQLAGTWEGVVKIWMEPNAEPMIMPGTVTRTWILGGRYLEEKIVSDSAMGRFRGLGHWGYNNLDGRYEFTWMDSMSTAIMTGTGSYNPDTQVFSTSSSHRDPMTGRMIEMHGKADVSNPDRHVFIDYSIDENGREFKSFEGIYERVETD